MATDDVSINCSDKVYCGFVINYFLARPGLLMAIYIAHGHIHVVHEYDRVLDGGSILDDLLYVTWSTRLSLHPMILNTSIVYICRPININDLTTPSILQPFLPLALVIGQYSQFFSLALTSISHHIVSYYLLAG